VLAHNYDQTLALSLMDVAAVPDLDAQARYMTELESAGKLDRGGGRPATAAELSELQSLGRASRGRSWRCSWPTAS
jgi:glutamate dehydrogenase